MKLSFGQIDAFLRKPDAAVRVVLVYGPDAGLVHERAEQLAKLTVSDLNDPFRVAVLAAGTVSDDPARLLDEMAAQALGGGRRLVRLQNAGDGMHGAVAALLKDMPGGDTLLVIEAGDLDKRSKLRALADSADGKICAIPCYVDDAPARQRTIADMLKTEGMQAGAETLGFLAAILPPDRLALRSEVQKLMLYAHGSKTVTIEDAEAVVQDAGAAELDDLALAVGSGDARRAGILLDRLFAERTAPVALLRAAQRHFLRLQWARAQMDGGASAEEAVKKLQPPVFWKHTGSLTAQVRRWTGARLQTALVRLFEAEAAAKRTGSPDEALCAQVLLGLAA
jgi:DNA polymerase-3 subunit delta